MKKLRMYNWKHRASLLLLAVLVIGFLLQIFTPLRLNTDSVSLLSMADSAAHGQGFLDNGEKSVFPPGYPALLAVLLRLGLAHSWTIVSLNMVFLFLGLLAVFSLLSREFFADRTVVLMICCLFLLSYVVVKHATIPLTEAPFFFSCAFCLLLMSKAVDTTSARHFAVQATVALLLTAAAITIRRNGVALVPPFAFMLFRSRYLNSRWTSLSPQGKRFAWILGGFAALAIAAFFVFTSYWRLFVSDARVRYHIIPLSFLPWYRLKEFGELFLNFPVYRMPAALQGAVRWIGFLPLLLLVAGAAARRKVSSTDVFLFCYALILFAWPYYDARFWWPVLPLLIAYFLLAMQRFKIPSAVLAVYCVCYAILGLGILAYSTRITFSGCQFPERFGSGELSSVYRAALDSCPNAGDPSQVDQHVLRLLREFR